VYQDNTPQSHCRWLTGIRIACAALLFVLVAPGPSSAFQTGQSELEKNSSFKPPRAIPKVFQIENETITDDQYNTWNKTERTKYQEALRALNLDSRIGNQTARQLIENGIRVRVARFSLKSQRNRLKKLRDEIKNDLNFNARKAEIRVFALQQIVAQARLLLSGNFHVRLHAVFLVSDLNLEPQKIGPSEKEAVAYIGGAPVLLAVLSETIDGKPVEQPEPIKLRAAIGLRRMLVHGTFPRQANEKNRLAISQRLLKELSSSPGAPYEWHLLHALADAGISQVPDASGTPRPQIVTALARVIVDPARSLRNRCRAARLLGVTPIPGSVQAAPIAWGIAQLATQIATQYGKRIRPAHAIFCFQDLYYAFVPPPGRLTSDGKQRAGLLSTLKSPQTTQSYDAIRPVMAFFLERLQGTNPVPPAAIPEAEIQQLGKIKKPASMSIQPDAPPIDQKLNGSPEERSSDPAG